MFDFLKFFKRTPRLVVTKRTRDVPEVVKTRSFINMPHVFLVRNTVTGEQRIATTAIPLQAIIKVKGETVTLQSTDKHVATDITLAIRALRNDPVTLKNLMKHIIDNSENVS